jgi:hypothetical protein
MESGVPLRGKDNNGHLDIVFVCGKADEITSAIPSEPPAEIGARLAQVVDLVVAPVSSVPVAGTGCSRSKRSSS